MKKLLIIFLCLTMIVCAAACGTKKDDTKDTDTNDIAADTSNHTDTSAEDEAKDTAEEGTDKDTEQGGEETDAPVTPVTPDTSDASDTTSTPVTTEKPDETVKEPDTEDPEAVYADLSDKLAQLTNGATPDELRLMTVEVPADNYEYTLFTPYIEGSFAVVSEPMIGSIAHSVVLLKLPEGADVKAVASDIEKNMDPRKWICVTAEEAWVKTSGNYVLLVMSSKSTADAIASNFETVFAS
ncbi:MAG: hypothetical protein ACI4QZ_06215 [Eubacteriales bacterium]